MVVLLQRRVAILAVTCSWCAVLLNLVSPSAARPQTNTLALAKPSQRCVVIVETSRAMKLRARGVFETVKSLLDTGLKGQLHRGDTLSIWTFNETLYTGWLPSQEWSSETQLTLAVRQSGLLQSGVYQNGANLELPLGEMRRLLRESGLVTVILLTTGEGEMLGTPFDSQINEAWKRWRNEQQKTLMPLVTVLRARNGVITQWSVTPAPWPLEIPPIIAESRIAKV